MLLRNFTNYLNTKGEESFTKKHLPTTVKGSSRKYKHGQ